MATNERLLEVARERGVEGVNSRSSKADLEAALEADGFDLSTLEEDNGGDQGDGKSGDLDVDTSSVQETMDAEQEQGFRGTKVDPTPNSAYTVAGVTAGEPTPETDPELRAQARARAFNDVGGGQTEMTAEREPGEGE